MLTAQEYLNTNYKDETATELDLSGWIDKPNESRSGWVWEAKENWTPLTGELDLSSYPHLTKLDCAYNQITSLNLANCPKLTELKCWGNQLSEIKFPQHLNLKTLYAWNNDLTEIDWTALEPSSLTSLSISNNNLKELNLSIITKFSNLAELYLGTDILSRLEAKKYNRFTGSLKSLLSSLPELKKLQIEQAGIEEDVKNLPRQIKVISWHKQNDTIARVIPLERLYVIRNNLNQFVSKWEQKPDQSKGLKKFWQQQVQRQTQPINKLAQLQSPEQFKKYQIATYFQYGSYLTTACGGLVTLLGKANDQGELTTSGGVISSLSPVISVLASKAKENFYHTKQQQWMEFLTDANDFLNNFNELLGIIGQFKQSSELKGEVNKAIEKLRSKINDFLIIYDNNEDKEIDLNELITKREELVKDLKDDKLKAITSGIKALESAIIAYRRLAYYEAVSDNSQVLETVSAKTTTVSSQASNNQANYEAQIIELGIQNPQN